MGILSKSLAFVIVITIILSCIASVGTSMILVQSIQGPKGDTGGIGPAGPKGDKGDTGPAGPQGVTGATGAIGVQGLTGQTGLTGATGPAGVNGSTWYNGTNMPTSQLGANGDYYLNLATSDVYSKISGIWIVVTNIKGATGATGATGLQGPVGYYSVYSVAGSSVTIPGIINGDLTQTDPNAPIGNPNKLGWVIQGHESWDNTSVTLYQGLSYPSYMSQLVTFGQGTGIAFDIKGSGARLEVHLDGYVVCYADFRNTTISSRMVIPTGPTYMGIRNLQIMVLPGPEDGGYARISNISLVQFI